LHYILDRAFNDNFARNTKDRFSGHVQELRRLGHGNDRNTP